MVYMSDICNMAGEKAKEILLAEHGEVKGHCQDGVALVLEQLETYGIKPRVLRLEYKGGDGFGRHMVVGAFGSYIDPTVSQFDPNLKDVVFSAARHPLNGKITAVEDVTQHNNFFQYSRRN